MAENINITPDMISNLVNMLKDSNTANSVSTSASSENSGKDESRSIFSNLSSTSSSSSTNQSTNSNGLDIETIMKIKSIMDLMNKKDDPNSKLLNSLKPYLRKSKQEKLDQYINILRISQITQLFNNNSKSKGDSK